TKAKGAQEAVAYILSSIKIHNILYTDIRTFSTEIDKVHKKFGGRDFSCRRAFFMRRSDHY
ncbi:MAG: hypothetical protein MJ083_06245, partial [Clostridia bacterium]|nr:hypothetical protein [Clostridia bacterium]